jgi:hypothetical protein
MRGGQSGGLAEHITTLAATTTAGGPFETPFRQAQWLLRTNGWKSWHLTRSMRVHPRMTYRILGIAPLFALALAACDQQPADDSNITIDETVNAAEAANAEIETLPPSETAGPPANGAVNAVNPVPEPGAAVSIPAQYRGRWGMVAADCEPGRSDAKGLMVVEATRLSFYESRAKLLEQRPAIATSFSGLFAFTGEGQNWQKVQTFTRTGDTLKRADDEGSYTYTRCS